MQNLTSHTQRPNFGQYLNEDGQKEKEDYEMKGSTTSELLSLPSPLTSEN